jgi:Leucine-rich repeat (LRR) protein
MLDSIPTYIDTFKNLEKLFLTDQNISALPNSLKNLSKLRELSFGGCQLTTLPDFIFEMKNLKELILFYNKFPKKYKTEIKKKFKKELPNTTVLIEED